MRLNRLKYILISAALLTAAVSVRAAGRPWEQLKTERADAKSVARDTDVEIKTAPSTIVVSCNKPMSVKVYTILGQLVSAETVAAGTSQLHIPGHGVYIVKISSITCKVAL